MTWHPVSCAPVATGFSIERPSNEPATLWYDAMETALIDMCLAEIGG